MGNILKTKNLTTGAELFILAIGLAIVLGGVYWFAPGLRVEESKQLQGMELDKTNIDNQTKASMLELPSNIPSTDAAKNPLIRVVGYAWNGETPIIIANGGPRTTKGSLMEKNGINLEIRRQDWLTDIRKMQMKFIEQYAAKKEYPTSDEATSHNWRYLMERQQELKKEFGNKKGRKDPDMSPEFNNDNEGWQHFHR